MMTMIVEREEVIVSPNGPSPPTTYRAARFLNPSLTDPNDSLAFDLPLCAFHVAQCRSPPSVSFSGFRNPLKNWSDWVFRLLPLHRATWDKAGIYDPIIHSTYSIPIHTDLLIALAHSWCPLTNTFVFPWGEATLTLEDVTVLAGFSLLGNSVLTTPQIEEDNDAEMVRINNVMAKARADMNKSTSKKVTMGAWMKAFMGCGGCAEHVAFLVLWLSYYVFPFAKSVVGKHLHGIAARLARGIRVALAPAILACLYRDLTLLKRSIVQNGSKIRRKKKKKKKKKETEVLNLWSHMQLVQIWAWERFPTLRLHPIPRIEDGEPRIARWSKVTMKGMELAKVRSVIESASESFVWRPYADFKHEKCGQLRKFYPEKEKWVPVGPGMCEEIKSFARIVRVSELVGINCKESYFPHRVSMQFGMDQDIPGRVGRFGDVCAIAWKNYDRPIRDKKLYIPSRSFQSGVTSWYLEWWTQQKLDQQNDVKIKGSNKRKGMTELLKTTPTPTSHSSKKKKVVVEDVTTPCFSPNSNKFKAEKSVSRCERAVKMIESQKKMGNDKRKPEKTDGNGVADGCMSSAGAALLEEIELQEEMENDEQTLETIIDGKTIPDDYRSRSVAEYRMENDKQTLKIMNDRNKILRDCRSSLCAKLQIETMNNEQILERDDGLEIPDDGRLSPVACGDDDVRTDFPMEPTVVVEITMAMCDETGNEICDGGTLSLPAETQIQSSSRLACNGDGVQTDSYRKPTDVFENTSARGDETINEVPDGCKLSSHAKPQIPLSSPLACNGDDVQMEFHLEPIEVLENKIPRPNESRNTMPDGDRLPQIQSSPLVRTGEQVNVCQSAVARLDEAEVSVSIGSDNGANINNDENQTGSSSNNMEKWRAMSLEDRITRLEILVARLKAIGQRSV